MISKFFKVLMILIAYVSAGSANPVKVAFLTMIYASTLFFSMHFNQSSTWHPTIFYLLFMGGILVMFMILSSILPNEKTMKPKSKKLLMLGIFMIMPTILLSLESFQETTQKMKFFVDSSSTMITATLLIGIYFLSFTRMMSKEKFSLRSTKCYKKSNFVNF